MEVTRALVESQPSTIGRNSYKRICVFLINIFQSGFAYLKEIVQ